MEVVEVVLYVERWDEDKATLKDDGETYKSKLSGYFSVKLTNLVLANNTFRDST